VFETAEPLVAGDGDGVTDVYMRVGATSGNTSLLSDRIQPGGDASNAASFKALELTSTDSPLTVFETAEPLLTLDGDGATDVYMRVGATSGNTSLLSDRIQPGADTADNANFKAIRLTGTDAPLTVFETAEPLLSGDTDSSVDVYMRVGATAAPTNFLSKHN
jgi:predicted nuclease with RNAse H fold